MARNVEKHTRGQALFQQRAGRVTASKLKAAVSTNMAQPSRPCAIQRVIASKVKQHHGDVIMRSQPLQHILPRKESDFPISKSGLVIDPSHPFMGAYPDSLVDCKCCGKGVIKAKCPYSCKQKIN